MGARRRGSGVLACGQPTVPRLLVESHAEGELKDVLLHAGLRRAQLKLATGVIEVFPATRRSYPTPVTSPKPVSELNPVAARLTIPTPPRRKKPPVAWG